MRNRDFTVNGTRHHLNDNPVRNGFEGRYRVLFWNDAYGRWQEMCTADTKKEAVETVRKRGNGRNLWT